MTNLNTFTLVLLLLHFIGDYPLQSEQLATMKREKTGGLLIHFLIHLLLLFLFIPRAVQAGMFGEICLPLLLVWVSHVFFDLVKTIVSRRFRRYAVFFYLLDQLLHFAAIIFISEWAFRLTAQRWQALLPRDILEWLFLLVLITKPANVTFKTIFQKYQFTDLETRTVSGAGALIGNMERILSAIFLASGQLVAIGFIYTAKSIARFKQIEENKQFAEYYLIGTLYSILYVTLVYYLVLVL